MAEMTDYLCPEGQRLWDEWNRLHRIVDTQDALSAYDMERVNNAWTAYLDHRAACKECTEISYKTVGGYDD